MSTSSAGKNGFTLIEVLVVIAIIGILAAIIFPVVSSAREKARQTQCLSNQSQLSLAIMQYADDFDQTYPWSYSNDTDQGQVTWPDLVAPYAHGYVLGEGGGILTCPDSLPGTVQSFATNAQVIGPFGPPAGGENYYQSVVPMNMVSDPTSIVLLGDAITADGDNSDDSDNPITSPMEYSYPHPALIKDHTNDPDWGIDWVVPNTDGNNNKQIAWLHTSGANFIFCDGHARWKHLGELTDSSWDVRCTPGAGCTGHSSPPNPADYPAISSSCGGQSALDCE